MDSLSGTKGMKAKLIQAEELERFLAFSRTFSRIPHLSGFLGGEVRLAGKEGGEACTAVAVWRHKTTADMARRYAAEHGLPYVAVEDGFLRSLRLVCEGAELVDYTGIYYGVTVPSNLEKLLNFDDWEDPCVHGLGRKGSDLYHSPWSQQVQPCAKAGLFCKYDVRPQKSTCCFF